MTKIAVFKSNGAILNNEEVEKLVRNVKITEFKTRDEQEVFGYYEALDLILNHAKGIEILEAYLRVCFGISFGKSVDEKGNEGNP